MPRTPSTSDARASGATHSSSGETATARKSSDSTGGGSRISVGISSGPPRLSSKTSCSSATAPPTTVTGTCSRRSPMVEIRINPPLDEVFCQVCGVIKESCICDLKKKHKETCRFLRAARLSFELACDHGFQACPECDPCDCGVGATQGIR